MQQLLEPNRKFLFIYILFVFITAFLLFLYNPTPWVREDLWGEDGRDYIAGIINDGFWEALYFNLQQKGYLQFFKFFVAALCLGINQIFFQGEIIFIPRIIAATSYLIYALVFCLPILLFNRKIKIKYLIAIAVSSCFVDVGPLDSFLVFGRILNFGFLSIYLCFLLVIYRTLFIAQLKGSTSIIDLVIFLCVLTQPTSVLLLGLVYIDLLLKKATSFLDQTDKLVNPRQTPQLLLSISLLAISVGTLIYFLIILLSNLGTESYATVYGNSENEKYSHQFFFGKFWFNQIFSIIYQNLSDFLVLLFLALLIIFIGFLKDKVLIYCLYCITSVSAITLYWRPGLLVVMKYVDSLKSTVYTMPSNLIFILMSFMILAGLMRRFNNFSISHFKLDNVLLCSLLSLYLITGLHTRLGAKFQPTISFSQGMCLANASHSQAENDLNALVEVPANPEGITMLLPRKLVKCRLGQI